MVFNRSDGRSIVNSRADPLRNLGCSPKIGVGEHGGLTRDLPGVSELMLDNDAQGKRERERRISCVLDRLSSLKPVKRMMERP